jgi:hypothetical protein
MKSVNDRRSVIGIMSRYVRRIEHWQCQRERLQKALLASSYSYHHHLIVQRPAARLPSQRATAFARTAELLATSLGPLCYGTESQRLLFTESSHATVHVLQKMPEQRKRKAPDQAGESGGSAGVAGRDSDSSGQNASPGLPAAEEAPKQGRMEDPSSPDKKATQTASTWEPEEGFWLTLLNNEYEEPLQFFKLLEPFFTIPSKEQLELHRKLKVGL